MWPDPVIARGETARETLASARGKTAAAIARGKPASHRTTIGARKTRISHVVSQLRPRRF